MVNRTVGGHTVTAFLGIVAGVLELDPAELDDGRGPATLSSWTSRKHLELIVALEEAYGVSFEPDEIIRIRSVCDLRETLRGKGALR